LDGRGRPGRGEEKEESFLSGILSPLAGGGGRYTFKEKDKERMKNKGVSYDPSY